MSSLFGSLETTKLDKVDVVDPSTATEDGKAAEAKSTYKELTRISGVASDAMVLAESKADLVGGKVPAAQLPSYVDDVLEYDTMSAFPETGEGGKIYVAKDTNKTYRWGGTQYVEISPSPLLDDTVTEKSPNGVKSSGIWSWVKSLLPRWLTSDYTEPATVASVTGKADKAAPSAANNLASLTADGNLADSEVPATRVPTAAKQLEWDGKRDRTDLSLDTWIAGEGAPESITGQPQWNEVLECWAWDWNTPGGVRESFRTWNASSPDDPGPIELYDELDIMSDRHFTATRDRIAKESQLTSKADRSMISATDTTFSNAVLAVGLNIDTNSVAVLNEIAKTFGGFPIEGTATTVGGLLAALAAAAAWLKKNKVGSFASVGGATATVENGVAKLDDFFTESNSYTGELPTPTGKIKNTKLDQAVQIVLKEKGGGDDEKTRAIFSTFARMDDFTTTSDESDSFDIAITKLSQLLGEDVAA